jgi:predicted lipoprotein with Yx(FWY)xxD motif
MRLSQRSVCILVAALAVLALSLSWASARAPAQAATAAVKVTSSQILVTPSGMTLYVFAPDKPKVSTCYATCAKFWPPLMAPMGTVPTTMSGIPGKFGVTVRTDGTHQLTYDGAPLYTFIKDKKPGDLYGQGLFATGGYWWAVVVPGPVVGKPSGSGY